MQPRTKIDNECDYEPDNTDLYTEQEMDDMETETTYWRKGKLVEECSVCGDVGCPYCSNRGYNILK